MHIFPKQCLHYGVLNFVLGAVKASPGLAVFVGTPGGTPSSETSENQRTTKIVVQKRSKMQGKHNICIQSLHMQGKRMLLHIKLANRKETHVLCTTSWQKAGEIMVCAKKKLQRVKKTIAFVRAACKRKENLCVGAKSLQNAIKSQSCCAESHQDVRNRLQWLCEQ